MAPWVLDTFLGVTVFIVCVKPLLSYWTLQKRLFILSALVSHVAGCGRGRQPLWRNPAVLQLGEQ